MTNNSIITRGLSDINHISSNFQIDDFQSFTTFPRLAYSMYWDCSGNATKFRPISRKWMNSNPRTQPHSWPRCSSGSIDYVTVQCQAQKLNLIVLPSSHKFRLVLWPILSLNASQTHKKGGNMAFALGGGAKCRK